MKNKPFNYLIIVLGLIPMLFWLYRCFYLDLWYDEVFSLEHFALVDFSTTLFYYPAPNNHIFYNLLMQVVSRVFDIRNILLAEEYSFIFRLLQFVVSLLCGLYTIKILKKFFHITNAYIALAVLFTTVPFMNFSLQLRGYCLSMLLLVMLVYYGWSFKQNNRKRTMVLLAILSTLLLYTIPSNLYVLVAFCGAIAVSGFFALKEKDHLVFKNCSKIIGAVIIGVIFAVILYLPIWEELVYNKFSNRSASGYFLSFKILLLSLPQFLAKRYALLLLFVPGLFVVFKMKNNKMKQHYVALLVLFMSAFIVSFVHQKSPYARVFIPLAPVFVLLLVIPIINLLKKLPEKISLGLQIAVCLYCTGVFIFEVKTNDVVIAQNLINKNYVSQNLYENYYLAQFFRQDEVITQLSSNYRGEPIVMFQQRDIPSTSLYLKKHQLSAKKIEGLHTLKLLLKEEDEVFILTSHKKNLLKELRAFPKIKIETISKDETFTTVIKVSSQ
ncbi:MAG: hypothetical protein CMC70_12540 [Flavobacteriaceae bacterium]|nr:hypothetical protein [Flavobacteriaceae bacterium]